jgi:hypothetical protein
MGLSFTIAVGPRQRSHSQVGLLRDSWPQFTVLDSRLPQPEGPGPHIYIPRDRLAPGTGFHFRRLLLLAGLRWGYSTPPPHRITVEVKSQYILTDIPCLSVSVWIWNFYGVLLTLSWFSAAYKLPELPIVWWKTFIYFLPSSVFRRAPSGGVTLSLGLIS